jgi:sigma-B regulation protein RsbU (phosphoserine phosphatase)
MAESPVSDAQRVSRVIFEYAARIGQEQDTDSLLRLNADMARDLVAADRCSIWLVDEAAGQLYTKVAHGVEEIRVGLTHGLVGACVSKAEPVVVNDASSDERFLSRVDQTSGYVTNSVLVIPLSAAGGKVIGAFQALNKPGGFSESDINLLRLAGAYSAAAIETQRLRFEAENARLVMHELELARDVQAGLLPQELPDITGIDCAAFFRPAKLVGGDYYDLIKTPSGALAFTVGDVSGKGIPAAVLMASIQASLRMLLLRGPASLTSLATDLNRLVYASSAAGRYSTLFCGLFDAGSRQLQYVNAGQSAVIVRRSEGGASIKQLTAGGTPIGLLPITFYEEGSETLMSGDLLVCFSDGISEARNTKDELWHDSKVEDILRNCLGASAREVNDCVVRAADDFAGGAEQSDDMTLLTIRVV